MTYTDGFIIAAAVLMWAIVFILLSIRESTSRCATILREIRGEAMDIRSEIGKIRDIVDLWVLYGEAKSRPGYYASTSSVLVPPRTTGEKK